MLNYIIKFIFVISLAFDGAILSVVIGKYFPSQKIGFDAIADMLGWLMGGALVFLLIGIFIISRFTSEQLKWPAVGLTVLALVLLSIPAIINYRTPPASDQQIPSQTNPPASSSAMDLPPDEQSETAINSDANRNISR